MRSPGDLWLRVTGHCVVAVVLATAGVATFPIRPGLRRRIELPEDLTEREAARMVAFIATLAVEESSTSEDWLSSPFEHELRAAWIQPGQHAIRGRTDAAVVHRKPDRVRVRADFHQQRTGAFPQVRAHVGEV